MTNDVDEGPSRPADEAVFDDDAAPFVVPADPDGGAGDHDERDEHVDDDDDDDVVVLSWWQHPVNVVGLVLAVALIGGMLGWLVRDTSANPQGNAADVGFLQDMRAHHEQAGQMSYIYLQLADTSPALRNVAGGILVGQNIEIGRMIQMLRDIHAPEAAETDTAMGWMGMPTTQQEMPGMATDEQLQQLAGSSGTAADELFVELMVRHHEAGVHMAEAAVADASLPKVKSFARSIITGQRGEIEEMRRLLP